MKRFKRDSYDTENSEIHQCAPAVSIIEQTFENLDLASSDLQLEAPLKKRE
jgi:hypothetical protein